MRKSVREVVEFAELIGWTLIPSHSGGGHVVLRHRNGETYRMSATPSDHRWWRNAKSDLSRLAGVEESKPNSAKYRHEPHTDRFQMDEAKKDKRVYDYQVPTRKTFPKPIRDRIVHLQGKLDEARRVASETGYPFHVNEARRLARELQEFVKVHS